MSETEKTTPTPEEIKAILEADRQDRVNRAQAEIQAVLDRERCRIVPMAILTENQINMRIEVVAQE